MSGQSWDGGDSGVASSVARVGQGWEVTQGRGSVGDGSLGSQVRGTGGLHCWLIHGNHSSVGMSHELGVQVQRTSVPCKYTLDIQTREKYIFNIATE